MKRSPFALIPLFVTLLLLSSCGIIHMESSSEDFPIKKKVVPSYTPGQTINVTNYYEKPSIVVLLADRIDADLKQYTDTAIQLLVQGLKHQDISVGATGKKSVKLRVHNVKYNPAIWTIRADLNITAELGNGKSFSVFHHNPSPMSGWRAVNGAITRATEKILKHPEFIQYLND